MPFPLLLQSQCSSIAPALPAAKHRRRGEQRPVSLSSSPAVPSRVRKQVVNIPSFIVRLDSQKHIDFSLRSPYGGGRPGRVKRKNAKKGQGGAGAGDDEEED